MRGERDMGQTVACVICGSVMENANPARKY